MTRGYEALPWITSRAISTVHYPNAVLALERMAFLPFERVAFVALRIGTEVLPLTAAPESMTVRLDGMEGREPWEIGVHILQATDFGGSIKSYQVETTPFTPLMLFGLASALRPHLDRALAQDAPASIDVFKRDLNAVGAAWQHAITLAKAGPIGPALARLRDELPVTETTYAEGRAWFDAVVQLLMGHEMAHTYVHRLAWVDSLNSDRDLRALEILADLVAVSWVYSRLVRNTPDTEEYRAIRGFEDHGEAIRINGLTGALSLVLLLVVFAVAAAPHNRGAANLSGGSHHPHSLVRFQLQIIHFCTIVLSRHSTAFTDSEREALVKGPQSLLDLCVSIGLVSRTDVALLQSADWLGDVARASELATLHDVPELREITRFLRQVQLDQAGGNEPSASMT